MKKISLSNNCVACPYRWKYLNLLQDEDIKAIQGNCLNINFKKGETICKQGTNVTHALYLAKGMVKLYLEGKKSLILKVIKQGQYIDLQTLFGDFVYRYSVSAAEDSMVCMINADFFLKTAKGNPDFLFELTNTISTSTNYVYKKINDLGRKQLRGRIADALLYFSEEIYESETFDLNFTRKEIAELSAMSTENAVRLLTELKKEGIISVEGRHFKVLQIDLLRKISEIG